MAGEWNIQNTNRMSHGHNWGLVFDEVVYYNVEPKCGSGPWTLNILFRNGEWGSLERIGIADLERFVDVFMDPMQFKVK